MPVFFVGDSITAGARDSGGGWANRLISQIYTRTVRSGSKSWFPAYNLGVDGNTSADVCRRLGAEIDARRTDPASAFLVVLAIGINDARIVGDEAVPWTTIEEYTSNLDRIADIVTSRGGTLVTVGLTPVDDVLVASPSTNAFRVGYRMADVVRYDAALQAWAVGRQIPYVSLRDLSQKYLADGLHPSADGHRLIADRVLAAIAPLLPAEHGADPPTVG